jgi:hypothetical protein
MSKDRGRIGNLFRRARGECDDIAYSLELTRLSKRKKHQISKNIIINKKQILNHGFGDGHLELDVMPSFCELPGIFLL